ncbi:MAG: TlpA family protein disulfide reductase [Candidatus Magasanikbacteria bacterium]
MSETNKKIIYFLVAVVVIVAVGFVFVPQKEVNKESVDRRMKESEMISGLKSVSVTDMQGNSFKLNKAIEDDKLVLINSWATWCPFCVEELKDFAKAKNKFGEDIKILAVNRAESNKKVSNFVSELDTEDEITFLMDPNDGFYKQIGGFSMPETVFVKNNEILLHKRGPMDFLEIKQKVNSFLK